jgi:hypothetical protein
MIWASGEDWLLSDCDAIEDVVVLWVVVAADLDVALAFCMAELRTDSR